MNKNIPLLKTEGMPEKIAFKGDGNWFIDFGKAYFGRLAVHGSVERETTISVLLGERVSDENEIDRDPPGSVRFKSMDLLLKPGKQRHLLEIPPDEQNTGAAAIKMPRDIGEVYPFRYCEIHNCPFGITPENVRHIRVHAPFNDDAAHFDCSDDTLNQVWELCKHTIKATTFCGYYVDGDRERIPYEADAYINQLSHYSLDANFAVARRTIEHLLVHPNWPTEWILHCVPMAWADYEFSGDPVMLEKHYDTLKEKTLSALADKDGLIGTWDDRLTEAVMNAVHYNSVERNLCCRPEKLKDIVDWPINERDGYELLPVNTVVNAFYYRNLVLMEKIARTLNRSSDAGRYRTESQKCHTSFNARFLDTDRGIYIDGIGSKHASLHANMFPLAFGLVPEKRKAGVASFIKSRGMACSVYGAQYLLEALFLANEDKYAVSLMSSKKDRSWWNMIQSGSTMTKEAWNEAAKDNLDWNHAWATAPANIIPRHLMGIQPLAPGFSKIAVHPKPGNLEWANLTFPTIHGPVSVNFSRKNELKVDVTAPPEIKLIPG